MQAGRKGGRERGEEGRGTSRDIKGHQGTGRDSQKERDKNRRGRGKESRLQCMLPFCLIVMLIVFYLSSPSDPIEFTDCSDRYGMFVKFS